VSSPSRASVTRTALSWQNDVRTVNVGDIRRWGDDHNAPKPCVMRAEGTARGPVRGVAGKVLSEVPAVEEEPPFVLMPMRFLEAENTPFHDFGVNGTGFDPKGFGSGVDEPRGIPAGNG
jgi:hypothetical protein